MKNHTQSALLLLVFVGLLTLSYFQFSGNRIAYVDSSQLINNYQGMLDARKVYQNNSLNWKANIDTLAGEVKKSIASYEKESGQMTAKERKLSQELIRTKQRQLVNYQKAIEEKAKLEDSKMTNQVLEQINAYLKKYGEEKSYKLILVATEFGNIAYAQEGIDITTEILEGINKEYGGQ
jgi:outer membrane protein